MKLLTHLLTHYVYTLKVFTVLLRRSERLISTIERRWTTRRRRPDVTRRLRLALLYLDAILTDLRRAADVIRTRTGPRVLALLKLAVRTQRSAVWRTIHGTTRPRPKHKPAQSTGASRFPLHSHHVRFTVVMIVLSFSQNAINVRYLAKWSRLSYKSVYQAREIN